MKGSESRRGGVPVRVGELLAEALAQAGPAGVWTEVRIRRAWESVAGPQVASRAWVGRLRGRVLEVGVADEAWAMELRYLSGELVRRLNRALGGGVVEEIVVRRRRTPGGRPGILR